MNVRELRQHLCDLGKVMTAAKASAAVVNDLAAICDGLAPFEQHSLKDFADFLVRADGYSRGEVPIKVKPKSKETGKGKQKKEPIDVDSLMIEIRDLYEHAATSAVTQERIDAAMEKAGSAGKNALVAISEAIGLHGMKSKTIPAIVSLIRQRIGARKGSTQRAELTDRPTANKDTSPNSAVDPLHSFSSE